MSDQRKTWLPWSDKGDDYALGFSFRQKCQEECDRNNDHYEDCNDYRPIRIPPPAEIEANARDATTLRWIRDWLEDIQRYEDYESFTGDFIEDLVDKIERTSRQYAAMKGGE